MKALFAAVFLVGCGGSILETEETPSPECKLIYVGITSNVSEVFSDFDLVCPYGVFPYAVPGLPVPQTPPPNPTPVGSEPDAGTPAPHACWHVHKHEVKEIPCHE